MTEVPLARLIVPREPCVTTGCDAWRATVDDAYGNSPPACQMRPGSGRDPRARVHHAAPPWRTRDRQRPVPAIVVASGLRAFALNGLLLHDHGVLRVQLNAAKLHFSLLNGSVETSQTGYGGFGRLPLQWTMR
jgi:hypothetical protein